MILDVLRLTWNLTVAAVEGVFWIGHGTAKAAGVLTDAWRARHALLTGELRCPRGHVIGTAATWECGECRLTWQGEPWTCPNPECQSPDTVYVNCDTCLLSQRSPYRWGSP